MSPSATPQVSSTMRSDAPEFSPPATDALVKGGLAAAPLRPAARGEKSCLCTGKIQQINSVCGWIVATKQISHPDAWKNNGCIYLGPGDFNCSVGHLLPGAEVSFYLYADEYGLGAEDCGLVSKPADSKADCGAGVMTVAPLWLLEDSDDDEDNSDGDDEVYYKIGKAAGKEVDADTLQAGFSTDCGPTSCGEDFDSDEQEDESEEIQEPVAPSSRLAVSPEASPTPSVVSVSSKCSTAPSVAESPKAEKKSKSKSSKSNAFAELQEELRKAREISRSALDEVKQLTTQTRLVTELREARQEAAVISLDAIVAQEDSAVKSLEIKPAQDAEKPLLESKESTEASSTASGDDSLQLETTDVVLSVGSKGHWEGECKSCSFFPVGRCTKGVDCPFCHLPHDRRKERKERRKERIGVALALKAQQAAVEVDVPPGLGGLIVADAPAFDLDVAVRSELMKKFGAPPGLELVAPPGL